MLNSLGVKDSDVCSSLWKASKCWDEYMDMSDQTNIYNQTNIVQC